MDKQQNFRRVLLAAVLGAFGMSGIALAKDECTPIVGCNPNDPNNECEFNHPISSARPLPITGVGDTGGATVNGVIGVLTGSAERDVDFYCFRGQEGDVVTIDIDGGMGGVRNVDTILAIFGPSPDFRKLRENDDAGFPLDAGSTHPWDARITNFRLPATGIYTVGVSSFPRYFGDGGTVSTTLGPNANGDYALVISGVTLAVLPINIEIKPGSGELAPVNPKSRGNIPVALLSSAEFNALDVEHDSLTFGATGEEASYKRCGRDGLDVNGDGRLDLVCHFENQLAKFSPGDLEGILRGRTADGRLFEGRGLLKVVPAKRNYD